MAKKYIELGEAIAVALEQLPVCAEMDAVESALMNIPAADVRPVVRGTWIGIDDDPYETWECDHCGKIIEREQCSLPNFCEECGADMREVDDD